MLLIKKAAMADELLQLAMVLSLLRVDFYSYLGNYVNQMDIIQGNSCTQTQTDIHYLNRLYQGYSHPKSLTNVLQQYQEDVIEDLNRLGRYNRVEQTQSLTAYVSHTTEQYSDPTTTTTSSQHTDDLTVEDMELIESLWKQDVDLGITRDDLMLFADPNVREIEPEKDEDVEDLKAEQKKLDEETKMEVDNQTESDPDDPWEGIQYSVDSETGERIFSDKTSTTSNGSESSDSGVLCKSPLPESPIEAFGGFLDPIQFQNVLEESAKDLELEELYDISVVEGIETKDSEESVEATEQDFVVNNTWELDLLEELEKLKDESQGNDEEEEKKSTETDESVESTISAEEAGLDTMLQATHMHPHHARSLQGRVPLMQSFSMEQRWQELASWLNMSEGGATAYPNTSYPDRGVLLHNATIPPPPMSDISSSYPMAMAGPVGNVGSAVATSMNLTNSSEPISDHSQTTYKVDPQNDTNSMMNYYQGNQTAEIPTNQTTGSDGFLTSILDEDLQLMDMAAMSNETHAAAAAASGMYMVRGAEAEGSDSAISSMGSTEWTGDDYNRFRPYYPYSPRTQSDIDRKGAQKKHHMYGRRMPVEQVFPSIGFHNSTQAALPGPAMKLEYPGYNPLTGHPEQKYSCSYEFARTEALHMDAMRHNHTYHLPHEAEAMNRSYSRDRRGRKDGEEHLTRDERRARAMKVPISTHDIINLPMDEFNERLSKYDLSEAQLTLIRDIRRRGKNKVAAQNCRKRKLDQIMSLADEVRSVQDRRNHLVAERESLVSELSRMQSKLSALSHHLVQTLHERDPENHPYSPHDYVLQATPDGNVMLVPRNRTQEHRPPVKDEEPR